MNALLANRAQSAFSRSSYRSRKDHHDVEAKKRPTTAMNTQQPRTHEFNDSIVSTIGSSNLKSATNYRRRPKTANVDSTAKRRSTSRKLRADEIDSLLKSLDCDDGFIVQVDRLSDYQTLVQTIDLRRTPVDCQLLCALQQRENRIVQRNACRDARFHSLMEALERPHTLGDTEQNDSNDANYSSVSDYPPTDFSYLIT